MTDYCAAIAALFAEHRKIPRITSDTDRRERWRIKAMNADIHRQEQELQEQAAKAFAAFNGWRHTERIFSIKTLVRGGTHAARVRKVIITSLHFRLFCWGKWLRPNQARARYGVGTA